MAALAFVDVVLFPFCKEVWDVDLAAVCRLLAVGHLLYVVFTGMHAYAAVQAAELAAYLLYLLLPLLAGVFHPAVEVLGVGDDGRTDAAADLALAAAAAVLAGQQTDERWKRLPENFQVAFGCSE